MIGKAPRPLAILLLLTILVRLPFLFEAVIDWDEASFLLVGDDILRGHLPYIHAWDNKPPLAFLPFALVLAAFGENGVGSRILGMVLVFLGAWFLYRAALRFVGGKAALWGSVLLVLYASAPPGSFGTMSEHLLLPLLCLIMHRLLEPDASGRHLLGTGIVLGAAVLVRLNMAYACVGLAAGLLVLSSRGIVRRVSLVALGALAPLVLVALPYGITGNLDLFVRSVFRAPLAYAESGWLSRPEVLWVMARDSVRWGSLFLTLPFLGGVFLLVRDARGGPVSGRLLGAWAILFASILVSMTGSRRYFDHYFIQVLPFVAVAAGRLFETVVATRWRPALLIALLVPLRPVAVQCKSLALELAQTGSLFGGPVYSAVDYLKERNVAGDTLYFTEDHIGYLLTDTRAPSLFAHPSLVINEPILRVVLGPEASTRSEILSIFEKRPRFVWKKETVWYMRSFPEAEALLGRLLDREYRLVARFGPIQIYERGERGRRDPTAEPTE